MEQKKVSRTKIGGHCQPLGDGDPKCKCKKVSGTKIGEQNKNGGTKIGGQNKKKVSGTKIGGHCQPLGDGDPKLVQVQKGQWNKNW